MKRTIKLNESELRRMIFESIKENLNEGVHRYKGFKCVNVSKDPSFPSYEIVSPDGKTIGSTLFPSEMKEIVDNYIKNGQMNETKLRRIVSESVKKLLKEMNSDYEGNDLDYDSIQMQAMSVIPRMKQNGEDISWRSVAEEMGFRLETLNGEDMELLKDAIEDVMYEDEVDNPYWKEDMEFENDFRNLPYANESKKANKLTTKILAEVTRRLKGNKKLLKESLLYANDIDTDSVQIDAHWTEDGYAEWEAKVDNGWYYFSGTYDGFDCELDEIIEGHSGHAVQHDIDNETIEWFNKNLRDKIVSWIEKYAENFEDWHNKQYI